MGLDQTFAGAFLAGLISFLSPCVLPLAPAYLCFLTGTELSRLTGQDDTPVDPALTRKAVIRAVVFASGFATVFVALGAAASTLGQFINQWFDWLTIAAGLIIALLGLHFLGVLRFGLLMREARFQTSGSPASLAGAYVVGLAFGFGWTPCVGPVLAAILIVAGAQDTAMAGMALLGAYAAGMGLPFVLAAAFAGPFMRFLARFRRHIGKVEKIAGAGLLITGLLLMTGNWQAIGNWMLETFPVFSRIG